MQVNQLLIDGDILVYRVGYACEKEKEQRAIRTLDAMIAGILMEYTETPYKIYLSGPSAKNYRHNYAVTAPYKGQRVKEKPKYYDRLRQYIVDHYVHEMTDTNEADDAIAIDFTEQWNLYLDDDADRGPCIVSIDKDFDQLPGLRFDFVKGEEIWKTVEEGERNLWCQVLTGDTVDNIVGIKGVGQKTSAKLFKECTNATEFYDVAIDTFKKREGLSDSEAKARVVENMRLVYLQRYAGDLWSTETHL